MAPLLMHVVKRGFPCRIHEYYKNGVCYRHSEWNIWGRWVFAAVFLAVALAVAGCINSHHRRRRGLRPFYGTGWMSKFGKRGNDDSKCCRDGRQEQGIADVSEWNKGGETESGNLQKPQKSFFPRASWK
ncbi:hypothetical protein B0T14DRAFT_531704 [Immersiella caudata]|uniref:Transmembrane protein n=1 Tax=Immersiella caudata TaxID=314043 RepID=A0AA39U4B1_9PEZI|nr:hypothetical protein B0T14DRAFT_531704 [Immersiella caudata]